MLIRRMIRGVMNRVRRVWTERRCRQRMRREQQREEYLVMRTVPHARRAALTPAERAAIRTLWGNLNPRISEREYEVFKYIRGFDQSFSLCKLIGWDVCLNEHNEPVIIELNSSQPGIFGEQIATGPLFGERTQEVIEYCCGKTFSY